MAEEQVEGRIERLTFQSDDTGYTVAKVKVTGKSDLVTVVGRLLGLKPGEYATFDGRWAVHPQYGRQFEAARFATRVPATAGGIRKYLGSGMIKGVGPKIAARIVDHFGDQTLEIIDENPDRLLEIEGFGRKRLVQVKEAWAEQKGIRRVMTFLMDNGVGPERAVKIYKRYGDKAVDRIRDNPYDLARDVFGIGFVLADQIAGKIGIPRESLARASAGLRHELMAASDEGHVFYPYRPLLDRTTEMLQVDRDIVVRAAAELAASGEIVIQDLGGDVEDYEPDSKAVYLRSLYRNEAEAAGILAGLLHGRKSVRHMDAAKAVAWVQEELKLSLAELQAEAVHRSCRDKVLVITGGPGTGKTTIVRAVIQIYEKLKARVLLAAPTGRAAKNWPKPRGTRPRPSTGSWNTTRGTAVSSAMKTTTWKPTLWL